MRKRISLRCCVTLTAVCVLSLFMVQIYQWSVLGQPSTGLPSERGKVVLVPYREQGHAENTHRKSPVTTETPFKKKRKHNRYSKEENVIKDNSQASLRERYDVKLLHELGIVRSPADQHLRDEGHRNHAFNLLVSDKLGFHRKVPDTRNSRCAEQVYPSELPETSVVICYFNEAWSALLRTVTSVLDRTPPQYLKEIIIVDDNSEMVDWRGPIKNFVEKNLTKVKYVQTPERAGLIRARMFGASQATGKVLVFLDSHCEVNVGWLEPLLSRIKENRSTVVIPVMDIINADTLEYVPSPLVKGGFNWGLHYRWDQLTRKNKQVDNYLWKPLESPTMAGGLFAIDRQYFNEMGQYDAGMDIWGGENLEISFRIWQCGGRLEIIPCSRVGHIFRKRRPYGSPGGKDTTLKNSLRVAHVWMDEYKEYFFKNTPRARHATYGDISDRLALRKRLGCKSFKWYIENIYPEQVVEKQKGKAPLALGKIKHRKKSVSVAMGQMRHVSSNLCVQSESDVFTKKAMLVLQQCRDSGKGYKYQNWYQSEDKELLLSDILCMDVENVVQGKAFARLMKCHGSKGSQLWTIKQDGAIFMLYNPAAGKCLKASTGKEGSSLDLDICGDSPDMGFEFRKQDM